MSVIFLILRSVFSPLLHKYEVNLLAQLYNWYFFKKYFIVKTIVLRVNDILEGTLS